MRDMCSRGENSISEDNKVHGALQYGLHVSAKDYTEKSSNTLRENLDI